MPQGRPKKNYTDLSLYPSGMTLYEYAMYRKAMNLPGGDVKSVKCALSNERISLNEHGLINVDKANIGWKNYTNPETAIMATSCVSVGEDVEELEQTEVVRRKRLAEMLKVEHEARLKEIEVEKAEGKLLVAEEVERNIYDAVKTLRDNIINIPSRLASRVAAETDEKKIEQILDKEIRTALENLSKKMGGY